jgi:hypothetical protein
MLHNRSGMGKTWEELESFAEVSDSTRQTRCKARLPSCLVHRYDGDVDFNSLPPDENESI